MSVLKVAQRGEIAFDPANKDHLEAYKYFVEHGCWPTECPHFRLKNSFISVPHMVASILAQCYIDEKLAK